MVEAVIRCGMALWAVAVLSACERGQALPLDVPGGDPERGLVLIRSYGCGTCHTIPGVPGANARVGPTLQAFARHAYLAGVLPNVPEKLVLWIQHPQAVDPRTAMPDMGVTEADARDIAAYLYTLKDG